VRVVKAAASCPCQGRAATVPSKVALAQRGRTLCMLPSHMVLNLQLVLAPARCWLAAPLMHLKVGSAHRGCCEDASSQRLLGEPLRSFSQACLHRTFIPETDRTASAILPTTLVGNQTPRVGNRLVLPRRPSRATLAPHSVKGSSIKLLPQQRLSKRGRPTLEPPHHCMELAHVTWQWPKPYDTLHQVDAKVHEDTPAHLKISTYYVGSTCICCNP